MSAYCYCSIWSIKCLWWNLVCCPFSLFWWAQQIKFNILSFSNMQLHFARLSDTRKISFDVIIVVIRSQNGRMMIWPRPIIECYNRQWAVSIETIDYYDSFYYVTKSYYIIFRVYGLDHCYLAAMSIDLRVHVSIYIL